MDPKQEEKKDVVTPATTEKAPEPSQDPVKAELDKIKTPKSEAEKAAFALKKNAQRAQELGLDPKSILGFETAKADDSEVDDVDDDTPLTVGTFKKIEQRKASEKALDLASAIEDESERELTVHHLQNTIKPSGNPEIDLQNARALVNAVKTKQILDDQTRKVDPRKSASGGSAPARREVPFEPTAEERSFMGPPWNLSKEKILEARKAQEQAS